MTPDESRTRELAPEEKVILGADVLYVAAFLLISANYTFGALEVALLLLVLASLGTLVYTATRGVTPRTRAILGIGHIVVGGAIALRYAVHFVTDLTYLSVLVLFLAVAGLGYGAAVKVGKLVASATGGETPPAPAGDAEAAAGAGSRPAGRGHPDTPGGGRPPGRGAGEPS